MSLRTCRINHVWLVACLLSACGCDEAGTVETEAPIEAEFVPVEAPEPSADVPPPEHGGTVVTIGSHFVEVVVRGDGAIELIARSEMFPAPLEVRLSATIPDAGGEQNPIVLTWDPARERFRGRMRAIPIPGPIEIKLIDGDEIHVGRSPTVVVSAPSEPEEAASVRPTRRARPTQAPSEVETAPAPPEPGQELPLARPSAEAVRPGRMDMAHRRGRAGPRPGDLGGRTLRTRTIEPGQATVRIRE